MTDGEIKKLVEHEKEENDVMTDKYNAKLEKAGVMIFPSIKQRIYIYILANIYINIKILFIFQIF